jgi:hypothetical protein
MNFSLRTVLLALLLSGVADTSNARQPNIIYVMLDDAGYGDFGAFGSKHVKTPVFDQVGLRCAPRRAVC